ncbi:TetR/AcrR family transcriptional regulator [Methylobacterium variabile]|jgi:AcrR family transcriptional regulator|uniref:TetR/AcrR family transcriptional regulator n=1 Tax=Methylobacterium variabile TaxID=298794 RepID=UPI00069EE895|nr:TetR/AcrR family transcriptional regulator [Methylobacterium variabile]
MNDEIPIPLRNRPPGRRRALVHNRDREVDIVAAARAVFEERGFEGTSVAEIARRARVAEGTLYLYAPTKRDLLARVIGEWYGALIGEIEAALAELSGTEARLRWFTARQFRLFAEEAAIGRLLVRELRAAPDYPAGDLQALNRRYTRLLTDLLREGIEAGEIAPGLDLGLARDLFFGGIEHAGLGGMGAGRAAGPDKIDRFFALFWTAIGGRRA